MLTSAPGELLSPEIGAGYRPREDTFDEAFDAEGRVRPHWAEFLTAVGRLSPEDWRDRAETLRRWQRDFGAPAPTGDGRPASVATELDPLPLLLSPTEWSHLEAGLRQRARLLSRLLRDCLGARRALADNLIPRALLYANPTFLRPCAARGEGPPQPLFFMACDVVRSTAGAWTVLSDYTRGPHGAGIALQNRLALSSALPGEFRDARVRRLAEFFQTQRDWLRQLAPTRREYPNIVLLTPGPYHAAWSEHVLMARYLGFTLVEGADLTARDRRVWIKTLDGLQPVDVILRYLDDSLCDPLELRSDSVLGIPGLLDALRAGHVAVANAPGSILLEANAWNAYLPGLCRRWLGEDLLLPSVPTWWCGDPEMLADTEARLAERVIRPAFPGLGRRVTWPRGLSAERRQRLIRSLRDQPLEYVGQAIVEVATTPTLERGCWTPRPYVLRVLMVGRDDEWNVMPGGVAHLLEEAEGDSGIPTPSGVTKDVWVLSTDTVRPVTLLTPADRIVRPERHPSQMPSRVADDLFWLGRYAERLEDMIRVLRCALTRLNDESGHAMSLELASLARLLVHLDLLPKVFTDPRPVAALEKELLQLIYHTHSLGTVREVLGRLRQIAFTLRDRFSGDTWRILGRLSEEAARRPTGVPTAQALALLNDLIVLLAAFSGMEMENMTRGHGWHFLDLGRRLERAVNTITLVEAGLHAVGPDGGPTLDAMLEIADSGMTYRRRYFAQPQWAPLLDLLLGDDTNPRSLIFQLHALRALSEQLPRTDAGLPLGTARLRDMLAALDQAPWVELAERHARGEAPALHGLLQPMASDLRGLSNSITLRYFSHAGARVSQ